VRRRRSAESQIEAGSQRGRRLAAPDAAWLKVDDPANPMVVTAVLRFAGPITLTDLRVLAAERLVGRYPSFSQRMVPGRTRWSRPTWQEDPAFDLGRHVLGATLAGDLDGPELPRLVGALMGRPIDLRRSPWVLHLAHATDGRAAVVARVHHCLADGMALAHVLLGLTDAGPASASGAAPAPGLLPGGGRSRPHASPLRMAAGLTHTVARVVVGLGEPPTALRGRPTSAKVVSWTRPHDLAAVRRAATGFEVTLNDVLLAAVAGGVRHHLLDRGEAPADLRVLVPVDLRRGVLPTSSLGNRLGLLFVRLPVATADPASRVRAVAVVTRAIKRSSEAGSTFALLTLVGALPAVVGRLAVGLVGRSASAVVTNVPGPKQPLRLNGTDLDSVVFWVPQAGRIGVGVSIFSYAGRVGVGVACDVDLGLDPGAMAAAIDAEIEILGDVAPSPGA
jgi:diacylglycerol O-acyltransferase / wax synthase